MRRREFLTGAAALAGLTSQAEALGLGKLGAGCSLGALGSVSNSVPGPSPAPPGYHWSYVTYNAQNVTYNGAPVVYLSKG